MGFRKMGSLPTVNGTAPPLAIDLGAHSLKLLQLGGSAQHQIISAVELPTPYELVSDPGARLRFQIDALPKLVKKGKFKTNRGVCVLPAANMFCKHMRLALGDGVDAEAMISAMIPAQTGCPYETLVTRHYTVPGAGSGNKSEVICMAISRELVGRLMSAMKSARLEPIGLHSPFHSIIRGFDATNRRAEDSDACVMYLDIGYMGTNVVIAHGQSMVFARTIELGGVHFDRTIMAQRNVSSSEALQVRLHIPAHAPETNEVEKIDEHEAPSGGLAMLQAAISKEEGGVQSHGNPGAVKAGAIAEEDRRVGNPTPGMSGPIAAGRSGPKYPTGIDLSEPLEILIDEIAMCARYHKAMFPDKAIDRAVLIGGESRQVWLGQAIARGLRMGVVVGDPLSRVDRAQAHSQGVDLGKANPGWAAVMGACLSPTDL